MTAEKGWTGCGALFVAARESRTAMLMKKKRRTRFLVRRSLEVGTAHWRRQRKTLAYWSVTKTSITPVPESRDPIAFPITAPSIRPLSAPFMAYPGVDDVTS